MTTTYDPQAIIDKYLTAFAKTQAGTTMAQPSIEYRRGWFVMRHYHVTERFRRVDLQNMTARLEARLAVDGL
jgi:hypothetical protein